jgi:hypothetical protein
MPTKTKKKHSFAVCSSSSAWSARVRFAVREEVGAAGRWTELLQEKKHETPSCFSHMHRTLMNMSRGDKPARFTASLMSREWLSMSLFVFRTRTKVYL